MVNKLALITLLIQDFGLIICSEDKFLILFKLQPLSICVVQKDYFNYFSLASLVLTI